MLRASAWRTAVGLGVPLGWSEAHLHLERIPGYGTFYVIELSVVSIVAAALTLGLVYRWGEQVPARVPLLGGGFGDRPTSGWAQLMTASYAPTSLWPHCCWQSHSPSSGDA